ncbi:MAG TPA: hypothetical protein VHM27_13065, partial [Rhizomicrobium sp.]|nr:hypothetical protein [Rhizomicrobium sp.]
MTKHAFTIAWGLVALMLTLALLRLALAGPGGTLETLALFGMPAVMAAAMSLSHWTLRRMPPALVPAWRRWQGTYYLLFIGAMTVAQAMMVMKP